jgi:hypothetical protein
MDYWMVPYDGETQFNVIDTLIPRTKTISSCFCAIPVLGPQKHGNPSNARLCWGSDKFKGTAILYFQAESTLM